MGLINVSTACNISDLLVFIQKTNLDKSINNNPFRTFFQSFKYTLHKSCSCQTSFKYYLKSKNSDITSENI